MDEEIRYYEVDLDDVIGKLRSYFEKCDAIIVVVFGSVLRRRYVRDVDVAVKMGHRLTLNELLRMGVELEDLVNVPVDLVPMDDAPPYLRLKILRDGVPVVVRDRALYAELLKETIGEVQDLEIKLMQITKGS